MNSNDKLLFEISDLLVRAMDNSVSDEEFHRLQHLLKSDPLAREYYFDVVSTFAVLEENQDLLVNKEVSNAMDLLNALAENEKTAVAVAVEKPKDNAADPDPGIPAIQKRRPRVSRLSMYSLFLSSAALFFILVYAHFARISRGVEVATLVDSVNARWADQETFKNGIRFETKSPPLLLREGYASFVFDNNVRITLEAPCEIQFQMDDQIRLNYGRLYAIVPPNAIGFQVNTQNAKIIDLGTEFGVHEDPYGDTELHVITGKTTFFAGGNGQSVNVEVTAETAKKFEGRTGELKDVPYDEKLFARAINSRMGMVWREPALIDLADVVGGGNGCGTGRIETGINPVTGEMGETFAVDRLGNGQYVSVPQSRYVDGVFVPDRQSQPVVVSSGGHVFEECPATNNVYFMEILHSRAPNTPPLWEITTADHQDQESSVCPNIFMHANLGITFDLDAIRADFTGTEITRFIADAGLSPSAIREGHVDVWVLVDGKVRYCQKGITEKGKAYPVEVELEKTSRFLTLVTTDGGDIDYPEETKRSTDSDWAVFAGPRLELSAKNIESRNFKSR